MNTPPLRIRWLTAYQWAAGGCDAATGLLLVVVPGWTFRLMGLRHPPEPAAFAGFIGVFVLGTGLAYLAAARLPLTARSAPIWRFSWVWTASVRLLVAIYLLAQIGTGRLEPGWLSVALTDGVFAAFQWAGLRRGWLEITA